MNASKLLNIAFAMKSEKNFVDMQKFRLHLKVGPAYDPKFCKNNKNSKSLDFF